MLWTYAMFSEEIKLISLSVDKHLIAVESVLFLCWGSYITYKCIRCSRFQQAVGIVVVCYFYSVLYI